MRNKSNESSDDNSNQPKKEDKSARNQTGNNTNKPAKGNKQARKQTKRERQRANKRASDKPMYNKKGQRVYEPVFGQMDAMPDEVYQHLWLSLILVIVTQAYIWFVNQGFLNMFALIPLGGWFMYQLYFYIRNRQLLFVDSPNWGFSSHFFDYVFFLASFLLHGGMLLWFGQYLAVLSWNGPLLLFLLIWGFVLIFHTFATIQRTPMR